VIYNKRRRFQLNWKPKQDISDRESQKGSVSVFFAVIMLVLITFLLSIFDYTRIQSIQLEASSNYNMAAELALSQYDPLLLQQYGLFAGHQGAKIETVFDEALMMSFYPTAAPKRTYLVDYYLSPSEKSPILTLMEPRSYHYNLSYKPLLQPGFLEIKQQILKYMKLREPYLFLKPFLSNIEILSKATKSSKIIEEKNELLTSMESLNDFKKDLYYLIDGIKIFDNGSWEFHKDFNFIRSFSFADANDYRYFPPECIGIFKGNLRSYENMFNDLSIVVDAVDNNIRSLLDSDPFDFVYIDVTGENGEELEPLLIAVIEKEATEKVFSEFDEIKEILLQYRNDYTSLLGLIEVHKSALTLIDEYVEVCRLHVEEINDYQSRLIDDDQVITSVLEQVNNELNSVKSELSISEVDLKVKDNLVAIKEQLEVNLGKLYGSKPYIEVICTSLEDYIYRRYNSLKKTGKINEEQRELLEGKFNELLDDNEYKDVLIGKSEITTLDKYIRSFMSDYKTTLFFDYTKLNLETPAENIYEDKEEKLSKLNLFELFKEKDIFSMYPELKVEERWLPSNLINSIGDSLVEEGTQNSQTSEGKSEEAQDNQTSEGKSEKTALTDLMTNGFSSIKDNLVDAHDTLLMNEYIIGMFSNVSKHNDLNGKTINGFKVEDHLLDYEAEYIIGGQLNEEQNLNIVMSYLYGIRIMLNGLHLTLDPTKRALIMNIATTIAGWWTGGVGAIIIAIIIGLAWALLESIADVFLLVTGERVPIIKTSSTWYTSLDGNIMDLFNKGVQQVSDKMIVLTESSRKIIKENMKKLNTILDESRNFYSIESCKLLDSSVESFETELEQLSMDLGMRIDMFNNSFDNKLDLYLDANLKECLANDGNAPSLGENPFTQQDQVNLAETIIKDGISRLSNIPKEELTVMKVIEVKSCLLNDYEAAILNVKYAYQNSLNAIFETTLDFQMEGFTIILSEMVKEKSQIGKKMIYEAAGDIKAKLQTEIDNVEATSVSDFGIVPTFSYEDYLRVFLILPIVDEETKLARIMDLIQMNTQKLYNDYEILLTDYYVGVEVDGSVSVDALFLPQLKDGKIRNIWELDVYHVSKQYE